MVQKSCLTLEGETPLGATTFSQCLNFGLLWENKSCDIAIMSYPCANRSPMIGQNFILESIELFLE